MSRSFDISNGLFRPRGNLVRCLAAGLAALLMSATPGQLYGDDRPGPERQEDRSQEDEKIVRIGDPGSEPDPDRLDSRYRRSHEWVKAGVQGGVPDREDGEVKATLKPGEDIQEALDRVGRDGGGVVVLAPGEHTITETLLPPDGVILRGSGPSRTTIIYGGETGSQACAVRMRGIRRAGLEDLSLRNWWVADQDPDTYVGDFRRREPPMEIPGWNWAAIEIIGSRNCWVQNVRNTHTISRPLRVFGDSRHITLRDNLTDYAYLKGGGGNGYYEIINATYVLMYNEKIRNIRHICLNGRIDYSVMVHCHVEVDINWHCIRPMANALVESVTSRPPDFHWWPPLAHYRDTVGPGNHIYRFDAVYRDRKVVYGDIPSRPETVYLLRDNWEEKPWVYESPLGPPEHGTLYPVTGVHAPAPVEDKAHK